ncbi:MAG TPA: nucleoside-diphosphate kinase [bacterium]|nr:nucleoside-diphosphate kinase [bacterium]HPJ71888.1 nucleoside-diphosphate kinase [bacterium]HPQ66383.1 nucleoside-diphosphate kinase [bacterium]
MSAQLAAVWINPYTIEKSRTGGVIARLLSLTTCELVAARMFAPSRELVEKQCRLIGIKGSPEARMVREHIRGYMREHWLTRDESGLKPRVLVLLFRGENAIAELREHVVGPISRDSILGETVRDTYGDYIKDQQGRVRYFEPAVFIIPEISEAEAYLRLWARYSDRDGGILSRCCCFPPSVTTETTLVMLKPGNFKGPSSVAGNVIDIISRTGLKIVGAKIIQMSVAQAEKFYQPVAEELPERMENRVLSPLKHALAETFDFEIPETDLMKMVNILKKLMGRAEFDRIIETMSGVDPRRARGAAARRAPGPEKCLALLYRGPNAISSIREVLGATDPTKARWATIRKMYAHSINENVAHASDSRENFEREIAILEIQRNDFKRIISEFYRKK